MVLTTSPRIFCLSMHNGKLILNLTMKEVGNVVALTERGFSYEDLVVCAYVFCEA